MSRNPETADARKPIIAPTERNSAVCEAGFTCSISGKVPFASASATRGSVSARKPEAACQNILGVNSLGSKIKCYNMLYKWHPKLNYPARCKFIIIGNTFFQIRAGSKNNTGMLKVKVGKPFFFFNTATRRGFDDISILSCRSQVHMTSTWLMLNSNHIISLNAHFRPGIIR